MFDNYFENQAIWNTLSTKKLIISSYQFHYSMGNNLIDYCETEKDLGININGTLNFSYHSDKLYSKANQKFGLSKRTCHVIQNTDRKRAL